MCANGCTCEDERAYFPVIGECRVQLANGSPFCGRRRRDLEVEFQLLEVEAEALLAVQHEDVHVAVALGHRDRAVEDALLLKQLAHCLAADLREVALLPTSLEGI